MKIALLLVLALASARVAAAQEPVPSEPARPDSLATVEAAASVPDPG